ncbi:MAG: Phenylalanine-tRNA ligase beta subunit [Candidatus Peribacteria bacterium GW2011_GWB1_54_5]|nr:MAG: Phenylalanine-tRNA ligase beta subunit [Candidatus Peribacteria bacterium GW2011_GWB1_54_5]KKW38849.1 MAG: Phenylalanine-tRNA ligase beta subunit [Candidatus Peribacteria bacterium GW2011_GWC2_54_8]
MEAEALLHALPPKCGAEGCRYDSEGRVGTSYGDPVEFHVQHNESCERCEHDHKQQQTYRPGDCLYKCGDKRNFALPEHRGERGGLLQSIAGLLWKCDFLVQCFLSLVYAAARMKLSLDWLSDFVAFPEGNPQAIADAITAHTAEVDAVERQGALLDRCCVGKVLSVKKHPDADRLLVCKVRTDCGEKSVVCGGTNLREGMCVAFAHTGATVKWHGEELAKLEPVNIRGVQSEGMICAATELELEEQYPPCPADGGRPIMDLGDGDTGVGQPLRTYFGFSDTVLDIDNHALTNRADLFSHVGFARECTAAGIATWKKKPAYKAPAFAKKPLPFKIHVEDKHLVPRYCACLLEIDGIGQTPDWMVKRLEATGWRSVSLPVDITNYVTMEVGMPLHSFDAGDLKGDIRMRVSKRGEKIVTLDGVERTLPDGSVVLSDDEGIFDLLGVMGGLRSSTKEGTKRIFLHSAAVDPVSIRHTIIATGHRTDAATIYEKGIPHVTVSQGFLRALELFLELVPGARIVSSMDSWGDDGSPEPITLPVERVNATLGTALTAKEVTAVLRDLEFSVSEKNGALTVLPPLHRLGDISGAHDLIEEIGRMFGYGRIASVMPADSTMLPARDHRLQKLRRALKEEWYMEFLPLSLLGPDLLRKCNIDPADCAEIENPLGEELSLMQPCVLPRLLDHAEQNIKHVEDVLQTFHQGAIFGSEGDDCHAMGVLRAHRHAVDLNCSSFLELKRDLSLAFAAVGYELSSRALSEPHAAAHPGRAADITVAGAKVGILFELHPAIAKRFDLPERTSVALINLTALFAKGGEKKVAVPLPQFPSIVYDETVEFSHNRALGEAMEKARKTSELLENVEVADLYGKDEIGAQRYKLTLRCTYRAQDRTLKEEEAKKVHEKVMKQFA